MPKPDAPQSEWDAGGYDFVIVTSQAATQRSSKMPSRTSQVTYLIDPPSPFAPADEWRAFIAELEASEQDPQIVEELRQAREQLAEIEAAKEAGPHRRMIIR